MIDFSFPPEVDEVRLKVREFMDSRVRPEWEAIDQDDRSQLVGCIVKLRKEARDDWGLWLPHMPEEWGGMALGPTAMAAVSAEAAKVGIGPFVLNAQAPDEGNQHTLLHWATDEQKEKYLRPLCEGTARSCFAMTEPEVAGSDPTLIQTKAYRDGDEWVINGHKWFISGARGAKFALLVARTEEDPEIPQAANTCFIVDLPSDGWNIVRDVHTMSGGHNHCEILLEDLRVPHSNMLGGQGQGHLLGQYRLGPARLAHCMRWIGQAEIALDMMVARSLERYSHGSLLAEKQGIQWLIADSAVELYQCKLMVLHAAYQLEQGMEFTAVVSMAKHFVANSLWRIIDRAIQVHGALGYSTDTPLAHMLTQARWAALRRRRRRDPPDAHRPAHHRRLQRPRHHQDGHRQPAVVTFEPRLTRRAKSNRTIGNAPTVCARGVEQNDLGNARARKPGSGGTCPVRLVVGGGELGGPAVVGLAGRGADDLVDEHDLLGQLVAGDVAFRFGDQRRPTDAVAVADADDRDDLLAPTFAGSPGDDAVVHRLVGLDRRLDLLGEDLLATGVDRDASRARAVRPRRRRGAGPGRRAPRIAVRRPSGTSDVS